jgi:YHS domain-containing protein
MEVMLELDSYRSSKHEMETENISTSYESRYEGRTYRFCCSSCKNRFDRNPEKFTAICWYHDALQMVS